MIFRFQFAVMCVSAGMLIHAQDVVAPASAPQLPRLEGKERMKEYLKSLVRPSELFPIVLLAGFHEARNFPHEWGRTGTAFSQRLGSEYAQLVLANTIELGFSAIHKEDNRYQRIGDGSSFMRRLGNVARSTVVVSNGQGGHTIALGQIAGAYGSWAIASQTWEPRSEQSTSSIFLWGSIHLAAKSGRNLIKEFGPDLRRKHTAATSLPPPPHP